MKFGAMAISPKGDTLASGGKDLVIRLWNLRGNCGPCAFSGTYTTDSCLSF